LIFVFVGRLLAVVCCWWCDRSCGFFRNKNDNNRTGYNVLSAGKDDLTKALGVGRRGARLASLIGFDARRQRRTAGERDPRRRRGPRLAAGPRSGRLRRRLL